MKKETVDILFRWCAFLAIIFILISNIDPERFEGYLGGMALIFFGVITFVYCLVYPLIRYVAKGKSKRVNPTHIEYKGKRFLTLTQLINYVRKEKE